MRRLFTSAFFVVPFAWVLASIGCEDEELRILQLRVRPASQQPTLRENGILVEARVLSGGDPSDDSLHLEVANGVILQGTESLPGVAEAGMDGDADEGASDGSPAPDASATDSGASVDAGPTFARVLDVHLDPGLTFVFRIAPSLDESIVAATLNHEGTAVARDVLVVSYTKARTADGGTPMDSAADSPDDVALLEAEAATDGGAQ